MATNHQIIFAARPKGAPTLENFKYTESAIPELKEGQLLLKTQYVSLDPYMRGRMNEGASYAEPMQVGDVMVGEVVAQVEQSRDSAFKAGELVTAFAGWQEYAVMDAKNVRRVDPRISHPSYALGILGMPGMTAYMGLLKIGAPKAGETVAVAAATGAVGSVVGQIAKIKGCRVVGVAGGAEKCRYAVKQLGFDACIDHYSTDFAAQLKQACPQGIDVYFENVGGAVFDAILPLLNNFARVPVCGLIAYYNAAKMPEGKDMRPALLSAVLIKRLKLQGFIVSDFAGQAGEFAADMAQWLQTGKIKYREDIVNGLENAPQAFIGLLAGKNFGKLIVKV